MRRIGLNELQRALEVIYGVEAPRPVEEFVVGPAWLERIGVRSGAPEELLVLERSGEVEVGLWISPHVMARLSGLEWERLSPRGFLDLLLPAFSTAAEGVSHFLYLTLQAVKDRAVSLLELEVQAEVDKFATALLHLWRQGERHHSSELRRRLFERVSYRRELSSEARERYSLANRLARGYASFLERRFILRGCIEGLLRELRCSYRLPSVAKFAHLAQAA